MQIIRTFARDFELVKWMKETCMYFAEEWVDTFSMSRPEIFFSLRDWNNDTKREMFLQRQNVAELFLCWRKRCLGFWTQHRCPSACHLIRTLGTLGTRGSASTGCSSSVSRDTDVEKQRWVGKSREIEEETDRLINQQTEPETWREVGRIGLRKSELWFITRPSSGRCLFP